MALPGPRLSSARLIAHVAPWSEERATRMPPPEEPPTAASQAMYTLSRKGLPGLVSAVIIGLSLKWFSPPSNEKSAVADAGYVLPPSVERATAIAVPLIPNPAPKKTTI